MAINHLSGSPLGVRSIVDRVLRKAIVQDLVWSSLYCHISASPFRTFGAEGAKPEEEWNSTCGGDNTESLVGSYSWPAPGFKTERCRYMTLKECRDALHPPVPSDLDPRSRLRKGFTQSLEAFESAARENLSDILQLTDNDVDVLRRLAKKAATVWLDLAMHRCRITILLTGPPSVSLTTKAQVAAIESV